MGGAEGLPSIAALRELALQNPAVLQPMIQQLSQRNPQLAQALAADPGALLDILGAGEDGEGEEGIPPGAHVVNVTPEERAAIERVRRLPNIFSVPCRDTLHMQLEALGFPRQAVIEAYFACDKNEELAANYLFEGGFD